MNAVVATDGGEVRGSSDHGVHRFLGIPYGTAERFRPALREAWQGLFTVASFGPSCPPTLTTGTSGTFSSSAS